MTAPDVQRALIGLGGHSPVARRLAARALADRDLPIQAEAFRAALLSLPLPADATADVSDVATALAEVASGERGWSA